MLSMIALLLLGTLAPAAGCCTGTDSVSSPQLAVDLGTDSAGQLHATLQALEPSLATPRLQLRLAKDTPVLLGAQGAAATQSSGSLTLLQTNASTAGEDTIGAYTETSLLWGISPPAALSQPPQQQLRTAARRYAAQPRVVLFEACVEGAALLATNRSASSLPVIGFPSVEFSSAQRLGYAYWHGLWPDPVIGLNLSAPLQGRPNYHDGPVVFSAPEAANGAEGRERLSLLLGPFSDPLTTVFGATRDSLFFGPSARVESLPAGHCYTTVAVLGDGVTDAVQRYGQLLQRRASPPGVQPKKLADPNLRSLSAWTDNGAFYFWNDYGAKELPRPAAVLPQWLASLRKQGVNVSTLQLDGWWMAQLNSTPSPTLWPGDDWASFLSEINREQPTPLLLYKAFFAGGYDLFRQLGCTAVVSPQVRPPTHLLPPQSAPHTKLRSRGGGGGVREHTTQRRTAHDVSTQGSLRPSKQSPRPLRRMRPTSSATTCCRPPGWREKRGGCRASSAGWLTQRRPLACRYSCACRLREWCWLRQRGQQ